MEQIILKTIFGSHLYGTNTENSDIDYKSIYVPNVKEILLQKIKGSISQKREKDAFEKNNSNDIDEEFYSLDKFLKLVSEGQTVSLDMLFTNNECTLVKNHIWERIVKNRHKLLTKNSKAAIGYCRQQANKYGIKGSRVAAVRDTLEFLNHLVQIMGNNKKLGDYASKIDVFVQGKEFISIEDITLPNGCVIKHLTVCDRKLPYTSSVGNAYSIVKNIFDEYGKRALQAEKNEGIDWKSLSHAVRIGQQTIELFQTKNIEFPRPNADFLKKIKNGEYPYEFVANIIDDLLVEVEEESVKSNLPESVDNKWIELFLVETYGYVVYDYFCDILGE